LFVLFLTFASGNSHLIHLGNDDIAISNHAVLGQGVFPKAVAQVYTVKGCDDSQLLFYYTMMVLLKPTTQCLNHMCVA